MPKSWVESWGRGDFPETCIELGLTDSLASDSSWFFSKPSSTLLLGTPIKELTGSTQRCSHFFDRFSESIEKMEAYSLSRSLLRLHACGPDTHMAKEIEKSRLNCSDVQCIKCLNPLECQTLICHSTDNNWSLLTTCYKGFGSRESDDRIYIPNASSVFQHSAQNGNRINCFIVEKDVKSSRCWLTRCQGGKLFLP